LASDRVVRPATEADRDAWQALVVGLPWGDVLQEWGWQAVAAFDRQPQRRYVLEEAGRVVAVAAAQVRPVGLRRSYWYVPHGPVQDYGHPAAEARLRALLDGLVAEARAARAFVLRLEPRIEAGSRADAVVQAMGLAAVEETLQTPQTRMVDLRDDEPLLASFDKDTRYAIRRAIREGVTTRVVSDVNDDEAVRRLHAVVTDTLTRARYRLPALERYRIIWRTFAPENRARIIEAWHDGRLESAALTVVADGRSFYLYAGSVREQKGETKRFPSYAVQWEMMRTVRGLGARVHDLWGVAPETAGPDHPWWGFSLFKKGFGGRYVQWIGSYEIILDPLFYRLRRLTYAVRHRDRARRS
jgi:lipid II:glycine glycyltransferase (peptidoglycan interpeptide bridge formation enzyme)